MSIAAALRPILLLALLAGISTTLPDGTAAQVGSTTDIITGRILGPGGEPLSGASVTAISGETGVRRSTMSNAQGRYTIVFPDGGGRYQLEVAFLGMAPFRRAIARMGDEDVLVADIQMDVSPITLEGVEVTARRGVGPGQREPGTQERVLPGEALNRLPVDPLDPASIALLAPGVVGVDGDTLGLGFSVFGQGPALNQITVDGVSFGGEGMGGGLGIPQEAVRFTRVVTNTYDVARGQFSGGQIATTTRAGTNRVQGSFNYSLRDPALQWTGGDDPFAGGFRQNRLSGGVGGPIVRDRLFYFGSFAVQRRSEGLQSLISADPVSLQRLGAHPDSVARFFSLLGQRGIFALGNDPTGDRVGDVVTFLGRVDYNITPLHTLTLRGDGRLFTQDNFRVGPLNLPQTGGDLETTGGGAMATLTSRFGGGLINELRAYYSDQERDIQPYYQVPEGRVRVTSVLEDGARSVSTLTFGGGTLGINSRDRTLEVTNELSWLRGATHRIRLGGLFNTTRTTQQIASNPFGSFTFNSLADFEANRPAAFSRSLSVRERESGGYNAALYLGDTWRPRQTLQLTYGVRLEGSGVASQPAHNPEVERVFGFRTDAIPGEVHLSPRVGFSYTLGAREGAQPLGVLRGGFGEFRARPAFALFGAARDATGLPDAQLQLSCIGAAAPVPDWQAYVAGTAGFPETCSDGDFLAQASGRAPAVTLFDSDFGAPRSWRASLGFQRRVMQFLGVSIDATYAQGVNLSGATDINLVGAPRFTLADEGGRPVFVSPAAIDPRTGQVGFLDSRVHPQFGSVMMMQSNLSSRTTQLTMGLSGFLPQWRVFFQSSYTLGSSRDQGSAAGGFGGFGGGMGGFGGGMGGASTSLPSTAGDPRDRDWAASDFDRRHMLNLTLGRQVRPWLDVTAIGRATAGAPFTPLIGADINGDGARNDRAFIFDPSATSDPAVGGAMSRLLEAAPSRVRDCLAEQVGTVAERNSCRGPWSYTLDFRANLRPELPRGLGRRLTISVDAVNSLAGVDRLLHGADGLRGWGQNNRPDAVLLYPRGFDAGSQRFVYEVNERFGTPRQGNLALRNPFQLQVQGQFAVGRVPQGFGGMMMGTGGGRGGRGGGWTGATGGGAPQAGGQGEGGPVAGMLARAFPNPADRILELRDTLGLTEEQVERLQVVADTLRERQEALRAAVQEQVGGRGQADPMEMFRRLQPRLAEARGHSEQALRDAEAILTPEQWARVPAEIRNPPRREFRGVGGGRP
jgi:hypothetical protein